LEGKKQVIMCVKDIIDLPCQVCGKNCTLLIDKQGFEDWLNGEKYIQDALPELTAGERELLISGTCDDCWKEIWGEY